MKFVRFDASMIAQTSLKRWWSQREFGRQTLRVSRITMVSHVSQSLLGTQWP